MSEQILSNLKTSLRRKIVLTMVAATGVILLLVAGLLFGLVSGQLRASFEARGTILARTLSSDSVSRMHLLYEQEDKLQAQVARLLDQYAEIEYALVLGPAHEGQPGLGGSPYRVMAKLHRGDAELAELVRRHLEHPEQVLEAPGVLGFTEPIRSSAGADAGPGAAVPDGVGEEDALLPDESDDGEAARPAGEPAAAPAAAPAPAPTPAPAVFAAPAPRGRDASQRVIGYLLLGLSTAELNAQRSSVLAFLALVLMVSLVAFSGLVYLASNRLNRRLLDILEATTRLSGGDMTERIRVAQQDEIGLVAAAINRIIGALSDIIRSIATASQNLGAAVDAITGATDDVALGAEGQVAAVDETSASMSQMFVSLKGIAENVEILAASAEESSSSILEMAATNDEMADNIHSLATSVEETTGSVEQMTQAIKEVAGSVEDLSSTAEQTSAAMREMDVSISHVETNADQTARLSEEVRRDAERGVEAVKLTRQGITRINDSTQQAFSVMETLGKKVLAIGQVLTVIDDVAEQTNLLALNAAIIAAQAGEHGKGFAVVADEIKDLAERTAASTSEIAALIQAVQSETRNALDAMDRGQKDVDEGVGLSSEAESALTKILDSATKSTTMMRDIARATVEQVRGSKEVTTSIQRIAETVQQIATATAQQAKGSEQLMGSAKRMRVVTQHVHASSQEQARGSKQITRAIESISEMVNHLNRAQKEQARGAEQIMGAIERIKEIAERHSSSMSEMKSTVGSVAEQAVNLHRILERFKL
ncbi:MAG TPA: methyl-accepting chemotaxis protein [Myxococcota bacterium]|nr:methyl-accepting chemotaxis protein [Myxococcota bacterium]HRY93529.1 methyl-accepting chemotaxis protein [Myxococcota bacterium]HSA20550.1 methyl-accepting chemotaxis protein [Myxococcota bacterium]